MQARRSNVKQFKPSARQATPTKLSKSMRSDGLILRVGFDGISTEVALKQARKIVRDELKGEWVVAPMAADSRDFTVRRKRSEKNPTVPEAFELAYKLRAHREVEDCEPSLTLPTGAPDEMIEEHIAIRSFAAPNDAAATRSSSAGGSDDDPDALACTVRHDWALQQCKAIAAWQLTPKPNGKARGEGIIIGHPDTGYTDHPELDGARVLKTRGKDFEEGDADPRDTLKGKFGGHGTSTGSVIMSGEGSGAVVSGIAPQARLVPLRVTTNVVLLSFGKLAEAIRFAADDGHHVLSISLGGPLGARYLTRAVQYAISRGVIVVAAAGNVWPYVVYPAKLDEVVAVAASNCQNRVWSSSASGSAVDITAPGESVWRALSKTNGFTIGRSSGTSYATAITAGAAALWLAHHGRDELIRVYGLSGLAPVFKELLLSHAFDRPTGWDTGNLGPGILNIEKLLKAPLPNSVAAGGMRSLKAVGPPRTASPLERFEELLPTVEPKRVRESLQTMLHVDESELNEKLNIVADELMYYAVIDSAFRGSLTGDVVGKVAGSVASAATIRSFRAATESTRLPAMKLPKRTSRTLKQMMQ